MIRLVAFDLDNTLYDEKREVLYDGVETGLAELKNRFDFALITNGSEKNQQQKLGKIEKYFRYKYFMGFFTRYKPDPWAFEQLLNEATVTVDEIIYIANNPFTDFIPCKLLGIRSIRVCTDEFGDREVHQFLDADIHFETPKLAMEYLKTLR